MNKKITLMCMLLFFGGVFLQAQNLTVRGNVVDEVNQPLVGATLQVKGTRQIVIVDINGNYNLTNVPSNATLVVSFIGYKTKEEAVNGRPQINFQLQPDATVLEGAVVTGMTTVDKRLFTGAADRLEAVDVKLGGITEISRALEGRSAGVSVQNVSGAFGAAPKIRIRGATSIYGGSKPLWVVDGVIMEDVIDVDSDALSSGDAETLISSAIAGLNSDDIESFQILKDGSATSIYGARAMAGVIVVTTKRGKAGVSSLSYNGEFTTRLVPTYAEFNIMNSQQQMSVYQEMEQKGWLNFSSTYRNSNSGVYGRMYKLMNTIDPVTGSFVLMNTPEEKNAYLRLAEFRNTDWFNELFQFNLQQNHAISMSGGTDKTTYYASISAMLDPGWYKGSSTNRYTGTLNSTYNIRSNMSLNFNGNFSTRTQEAPGSLDQSIDAVYGEVKRDFDINPYSYALNTSRTMNPSEVYTRNYADFNILNELKNNYMDIHVTDLKFAAEFRWKILPELSVSALGSYQTTFTTMEHHIKDNSNQAMAYRAMPDATVRDRNSYLYTDPDVPYSLPISILPEGGIYKRSDRRSQAYNLRTSLSWNKVFNSVHITNFYGGMELNSLDRNSTWFRGWGRQYEMGDVANYAYKVFKQGSERGEDYYGITDTRDRNAAFFATATYSYRAKYTLTGTARYDGSNRLGRAAKSRWLPTWNVAGSYNIHEEDYFDLLRPAFSHLTLRATYSLTGDRGPSWVNNSRMILRPDVGWRYWGDAKESSLYISSIENSELTYEKKHELNIGFDMGFLRNRINLVTDIFWRNNFDLIGQITTQGVGGVADKYANVAAMKSNGVEFTLTTKNIEKKNFRWTTNATFAYVKTEITKLEQKSRVIDLVAGTGFAMKGYPRRSLFSIPFVGLTEDGFPILINESGQPTSNTSYVYMQERVKVDFLKYEGPSEPTITGGFGNMLTYKNFRFNVFLTYSFGNKVRLNPVFRSSYSDLTAMPKEFENRWVVPGDEAYTNIPSIVATRQLTGTQRLTYHYNAYNYSDVRVADGGFVRLKEISLTYDLPGRWANAIGMKNVSAKVQGTNLFLLYADSKLNGQDPEFFRSGGVSAPVPKQITFTLRLGL